MESSKMKEGRAWFIAFIVFVCGLLILEISLRSFVYRKDQNTIYNSDFQNQNIATTHFFQAVEGYGNTDYVATDEIATPYTGGTSILVMGDSFTEGFQVNDNEKYVSVAEKLLHDRGIQADLHNLGKSASKLPDYLYLFDRVNQLYKPKIVVLQLGYENLISDEGFNINQVNYFTKNPDGSLHLEHNPSKDRPHYSFLRFLNRNLSLISYGYERFQKIEYAVQNKYSTSELPDISNLTEKESILAQISIIRNEFAGEKLVIILTPPFPYFDKDGIILDNSNYDQLVALFKNIPEWIVIDPSAAFVNLLNQDLLPSGFNNTSPGDGHWNVYGQAIVGKLLADELEKELR